MEAKAAELAAALRAEEKKLGAQASSRLQKIARELGDRNAAMQALRDRCVCMCVGAQPLLCACVGARILCAHVRAHLVCVHVDVCRCVWGVILQGRFLRQAVSLANQAFAGARRVPPYASSLHAVHTSSLPILDTCRFEGELRAMWDDYNDKYSELDSVKQVRLWHRPGSSLLLCSRLPPAFTHVPVCCSTSPAAVTRPFAHAHVLRLPLVALSSSCCSPASTIPGA